MFPEDVIVKTCPSTDLVTVCPSAIDDIQDEDDKSMFPEKKTMTLKRNILQ